MQDVQAANEGAQICKRLPKKCTGRLTVTFLYGKDGPAGKTREGGWIQGGDSKCK